MPTRPAPPPPKTGDSTNGIARRNTTLVAPGITRPFNDVGYLLIFIQNVSIYGHYEDTSN